MNLIEKIIANHSSKEVVKPGEIIDVGIDARVARDFGGANVVKNLVNNELSLEDPSKTFFTFDCNPGGSDQKYAANQHYCRQYARNNGIRVFDVNEGIGTHLAIDKGMSWPGSTFVSTDSHANILGAIGAFGQGMGDQDIAATWAGGKIWFKVPHSVKLNLYGKRPEGITAKDIVLNLLKQFGANTFLGYSVEVYGDIVEILTLDERITISSMATEMGAIIVLFTPNKKIIDTLEELTGKKREIVKADDDAVYKDVFNVNVSKFIPMLAMPGHPHDDAGVETAKGTKIDSAFIGSCTNGRLEDLRMAAGILKGRKVAPGVVLKIVPSTDVIWKEALSEGLISIFKEAGALVSNAGCAGCAAGQVGQNGPGEITISTGNRNFSGKQGKGMVYLASPAVVAASAVAGYITLPNQIPDEPAVFDTGRVETRVGKSTKSVVSGKPVIAEGRAWMIMEDNIDTDMIFHNSHLTITDIKEMGKHTFGNLKGFEDFPDKSEPGDIIIVPKNFGAGSSRQQAVDCFKALGIQCIIAESFGAIYERNAINAAMPVLIYEKEALITAGIINGDKIRVDFLKGELTNLRNNISVAITPFSEVQLMIYKKGGLLSG